jgi:uncharacterized protein (TIGR02996 family)
MGEDAAFLKAVEGAPADDVLRLVYADWLEERGDSRGPFLRACVALGNLPPDHPDRPTREHNLSLLRKGHPASWLAVVEPERAHLYADPPRRPACDCFDAGYKNCRWSQPRFHLEPQDTECPPWRHLLELVEEAAADGRAEFAPLREMGPDERAQIVTLPPTIAKLKAVRHLILYGSHLVRLPAEIGEMTALEEFTPYTSYRLHWFPYEITRCRNLRQSTVSTRALYGNYKYRPPFPRLGPGADAAGSRAARGTVSVGGEAEVTRPCSGCGQPFVDRQRQRVWISVRVATDVLPLLVNACSEECVERLPMPPDGYLRWPHRGGVGRKQPPRDY